VILHILEKSFVTKSINFFWMRSSLLESVIVTEFQAPEAYSSLDLTKAKYSISSRRWKKEMLFCKLAVVISVHGGKENRCEDENEVCNQLPHPNP
jgi:hypothetical protein